MTVAKHRKDAAQRTRRVYVCLAACLLTGGSAWAQITAPALPGAPPRTPDAATAAAATAPAANNAAPSATTISGSRYVEACQQSLERGMGGLGCQGALYGSEISRLKEEALRTNNPALLTLLGDAYQSNRSAISDVSQAYRWYLLGAVRGDPRAMQRLSELYRNGRGVPQDKIKALGYARLTQRLSLPGTTSAKDAADAIGSLGSDMATEEVVLAERFASELEASLARRTGEAQGAPAATTAAPQPPPPSGGTLPGSYLPGTGSARAPAVSPPAGTGTPFPSTGAAGSQLPGRENITPQ